ncbi:MAG: M23 family metallopeptidase [Muribaculaceae bacterium]|nr:M23 family metallopeptidase [Muribaculaceae bacterium]
MKKNPLNRNSEKEKFKLRGSWKLSIVDLNRLQEVWGVRLTRPRVIATIVGFLMIAVALGVLLITFTPFSFLLPGYLNRDSRNAYERLDSQTDSLTAVVANQTVYLENMMALLLPDPEIAEIPVVVTEDSIHLIPVDSLLPTSKVETAFVARHEEEEKYKLSVLTPLPSKILPFVAPVKGGTAIGEEQSSQVTQPVYITPSGASVNSCYGGRVIASYFTPGSGATVIIQHPLNFISVYRGLDRARVSDGDKVLSGQSIGSMPTKNPLLEFELWLDGDRVNPADYFTL